MIVLSRLVASLILLTCLAVPACEDSNSNTCTLIGCPGQGLDIVFKGDVAPAATLEIEVALVEPPNVAPVIRCTLSGGGSDAGAEPLFCNSGFWASEVGRTLHTHEILPMVRVTISSGGTQLSQQTFSPTYTRTQPNGPGCNVCVFSTIDVVLPQPAP